MKNLSIFVDESGDFGSFCKHSPYYIISMVLHDQSVDISEQIKKLDKKELSKSEQLLFHSVRDLKRDFMKRLKKKRYLEGHGR